MLNALAWRWDGASLNPLHARRASSLLEVGEVYRLEPHLARSDASHRHFFAVVGDAWDNLPEHLAARFPTADSLRHYALCKGGFCDVETFVGSSRAEALRLSAFIRSGAKDGVQVVVDGATVTRLTPHSQSLKAMGAKTFQESKARVLEIIADLLEVRASDLSAAA